MSHEPSSMHQGHRKSKKSMGGKSMGRKSMGGKSMGGKSMGGKSSENSLTNPGFLENQISAKSQGLKTSWPFFTKFFKFLEICIMFRYWIFDAVPSVVVPEFIFRTDGETTDFCRPKPNIEKITNGILRI